MTTWKNRKSMRKILAVCTALMMLLTAFNALAESEAPGTKEFPTAGIRVTLPEACLNTKGVIEDAGLITFAEDIDYVYWVYGAATEEQIAAARKTQTQVPGRALFHLFSIAGGKGLEGLNSILANPLPEESVRVIGEAGDRTVILFMGEPDTEFMDAIDPEFREEYARLAGMRDEIASGITCIEPYDPVVGTKIEFETKDLDGNSVTSADLFAQNEVTMINVWATWCGPCIGELSELQQIHSRMQEKNCGIVGLLTDADLEAARRLVEENGVEYPVILAPDNLMEILPVNAYPTSYFVGRDGTVLDSAIVGAYVEKYEPMMEKLRTPAQ